MHGKDALVAVDACWINTRDGEVPMSQMVLLAFVSGFPA